MRLFQAVSIRCVSELPRDACVRIKYTSFSDGLREANFIVLVELLEVWHRRNDLEGVRLTLNHLHELELGFVSQIHKALPYAMKIHLSWVPWDSRLNVLTSSNAPP